MRSNLDVRSLADPFLIATLLLLLLGLDGIAPSRACADELHLKNGLILQGTAARVPGLNLVTSHQNNQGPVPNYPFWMIDDGVRRYFVPTRQVVEQLQEDQLSRLVSFELTQKKTSRTVGPRNVGAAISTTPFDEYGHRTVTLASRRGPIHIIQGITEIRPDYCKVESLSHLWELAIDTRLLPGDILQSLIAQASDRSDPAERKATLQFYLQGDMLDLAEDELNSIAADFPELSDWADEFRRQIAELKARRALYEIERRRLSGQHQLAYYIAQRFPADRVSADVLRVARDIVAEYDRAAEQRDRILMELDRLQAMLPLDQAQPLEALRVTVTDEMYVETLDRFEPFLRALEDDSLRPDQKLALAYSGWVVGAANAILDLEAARQFWQARFLILQYLRESDNPYRREELVQELSSLEGMTIQRVEQLVKHLPLPFETPTAAPGEVIDIEVPGSSSEAPALRYSLMLPPEYSPQHRYPMIVALKGEGRSFENSIRWWGGNQKQPGWAQRRGYVVIAPHYCAEDAIDYDYSPEAHHKVIAAIRHVRQRVRIDSDRIFLTGHGMGGDACFDIATAHPDIFAGVIPFTGISDRYASYYWDNAPHLGWYVVGGQRDRDSLERNARDLNKMMKYGYDVVYCDYKERGFESYYEEVPRIFDWMVAMRRPSIADFDRWEASSLRTTENRFHWMESYGLPPRLYQPISWEVPQRKIRPVPFKGIVTPGGTIYVEHPGEAVTIWLSPELVDFDQRTKVHVNRRRVFNEFIEPSIGDLLEDLRIRGDRERLFWKKIDL